jgi:DNA gyrase subunit B
MTKEKEINIISLDFPECVRLRPGMYVGGIEKPDVILREAIDNTVDELMGSISCNKVDIQLKDGKKGGWYVISDNGRGIPIIMDEEKNITKCELAVGSLHAGSKFKKEADDIAVGLNGVGVSCTNALSSQFLVMVRVKNDTWDRSIQEVKEKWPNTGNLYYYIYFEKGIKIKEGADSFDNLLRMFNVTAPTGMSTIVAFIPDAEIWESIHADYNKKSLAYIRVVLDKFYNKKAEIIIDGESVDSHFEPYKFEFLKKVTAFSNKENRNKVAQFYINFDVDKDLSISEESGSVNSLVVNRGLHIDWTKMAFADALRNHYNIQHDYLLPGFKFNVICLTANMDFNSQTKERCVKIDGLQGYEVLPDLICEFHNIFAKNDDYFKDHVARLQELADSYMKISAMEKVKQIVGTVEGGNRVRSKIPSSVKDASSNNRSDCELFICEGRSASGTMLKVRNPEIHAILELRGVPLNAINLDLDTIMENEEMNSIVTCIGAGVNEYFRIENCRYGKIILAADSDVDGERINSMILGFIARKMTFLIDNGMTYIALAPLYHQGNTYVYPGEDPKSKLDMSKAFKRYKGIGEINVAEAKDFYFDENKRNLIQVTSANLGYVFELLTMSSSRKDLMVNQGIITDPYNTGIV